MTGTRLALADFCEIIQGGRHKLSGNDFVEDGFPAYGAGGMNGLLPSYEFEEPAVILSSIGARCGKCFFADGKWSSLANTQVIRPHPGEADCKFLWYQLNDESRWPRAGTGQPFIKPSDVKSHLVFLPPLGEQRRIAAILDKADALRAKRREALAQLDRLAQSIFVDMFGDPVSNSRGWDQASFEQFFLDKTSSCEKLPSSGYQGEGVFPVIDQGQAAIAGFCDDESLLAEVALPVTLFGDHTRTVKHVNFPFVVGADGAKVLKAVEWVNPRFASHLLANLPIPNLGYSRHMKEVKRLTFIVPPRVLQDSFEIRLTALDKVRVQHQRAALSSDFLSESLQHRAFRGELR